MNAGYDPFLPAGLTPKLELLNRLKADGPRVWDDVPFDAIPFYTAVEYLRKRSRGSSICRWEKQMTGRMEEDTASIWTPRTASTLT